VRVSDECIRGAVVIHTFLPSTEQHHCTPPSAATTAAHPQACLSCTHLNITLDKLCQIFYLFVQLIASSHVLRADVVE
jgi:hypothetical protein